MRSVFKINCSSFQDSVQHNYESSNREFGSVKIIEYLVYIIFLIIYFLITTRLILTKAGEKIDVIYVGTRRACFQNRIQKAEEKEIERRFTDDADQHDLKDRMISNDSGQSSDLKGRDFLLL